MTHQKTAVLAVIGAVFFLASCSAGDESAGGSVDVAIQGFAFRPADITAGAGEPIVWTNNDNVTHTVTFDGGQFNEVVPAGGQYSALPDPGTYSYMCTIHPSMTGTVTVEG